MSGLELEEPGPSCRHKLAFHKHVHAVRDSLESRRTNFEPFVVKDLRDGEARGARYFSAPASMMRRLGDALWRGGGGGSMLYPTGSRGGASGGVGGKLLLAAPRCAAS